MKKQSKSYAIIKHIYPMTFSKMSRGVTMLDANMEPDAFKAMLYKMYQRKTNNPATADYMWIIFQYYDYQPQPQRPPAQIRFSQNWNNKLDAAAFGTIRLADTKKYIVGQVLEVVKEYQKDLFDVTLENQMVVQVEASSEMGARQIATRSFKTKAVSAILVVQ